MEVNAKVFELKDVVVLSQLNSSIGSGVVGKKRLFDYSLLRVKEGKVFVGKKEIQGQVQILYSLVYDLDESEVLTPGEVAVELEKVEKILNGFNIGDMVKFSFDSSKICFEREVYPKRKVYYTPPEIKKFGDIYRWTSPYSYDVSSGVLKKGSEVVESAYALVNSTIVRDELKACSFTAYDKINVVIKDGCMSLRVGDKLIYSESDISSTVRGEVDVSYGVGIENVFSSIADYGGEVDLIFIKPKDILYINYASGKFRLEVFLPPIKK